MFAFRRTSPRPNAAHKQHTRTVVLFQIIDIRLETSGIATPTRARAPVLDDMMMPSSLVPLAPSGRATGVGVATEIVVFTTSVVASVKPAAVAAMVVVIVSVVNVPGTS